MPYLKKFARILIISVLLLVGIFGAIFYFNPVAHTWLTSRFTHHTVESRLSQYEQDVDERLKPIFAEKNLTYPSANVKLVFIKDEKTLYLYAGNTPTELTLIKKYEVQAASGKPGPKLKEGDHQVPEGIYKIESLNPNSKYHLSLRVNYPNNYDKEKAKLEGRTNLGSDIMIHGKNVSIGCIAIGDEAIEEVFVLAAKSNYQNWELIFMPTDLRTQSRIKDPNSPSWTKELDTNIKNNLISKKLL